MEEDDDQIKRISSKDDDEYYYRSSSCNISSCEIEEEDDEEEVGSSSSSSSSSSSNSRSSSRRSSQADDIPREIKELFGNKRYLPMPSIKEDYIDHHHDHRSSNSVYVGVGKSESSMEALTWTLKHAADPSSTTVYLIHVFPEIHYIPSPCKYISSTYVYDISDSYAFVSVCMICVVLDLNIFISGKASKESSEFTTGRNLHGPRNRQEERAPSQVP